MALFQTHCLLLRFSLCLCKNQRCDSGSVFQLDPGWTLATNPDSHLQNLFGSRSAIKITIEQVWIFQITYAKSDLHQREKENKIYRLEYRYIYIETEGFTSSKTVRIQICNKNHDWIFQITYEKSDLHFLEGSKIRSNLYWR